MHAARTPYATAHLAHSRSQITCVSHESPRLSQEPGDLYYDLPALFDQLCSLETHDLHSHTIRVQLPHRRATPPTSRPTRLCSPATSSPRHVHGERGLILQVIG